MESRTDFHHVPVLARQALDFLNVQRGGTYIDCTAGGGGHTSLLLAGAGSDGRVLALDRDEDACSTLRLLGSEHPGLTVIQSDFADLALAAEKADFRDVNGILFDLGVSSHQLDTPERGFSFLRSGPLDMRMSRQQELTAADVVNTYSENELRRILREYGEEKFAGKIASRICARRKVKEFENTLELAETVQMAVPRSKWPKNINVATRTFQAIRIEVNSELEIIEKAIRQAVNLLAPGGRIAVISFHSLEDRIVKLTFRDLTGRCQCPPGIPLCRCGVGAQLRVLSSKPVTADEEEMAVNPRSRSAKMRVGEKI
ncbi:MAG: 16S rRNA (cytosine(1402)-N(4))-methyltransferase [Candidatus Wallbacteria bacterium HGW-Wallbacteria-1]|uniref:Ribosomal RNA small subunit methyltransferase H n=1 Tax=Candidatus Wallbacteria bacterium HGW-Wallbacteria-1 TaxID=2013854 RepID=A0A2N1PQP4_9BACT|nr:MAG: 16S rRNA (cytosine(1402)-N(4))-methyltransferase [Candidatus Wallbacteria bacterium HGW-Wallbacteria-1]